MSHFFDSWRSGGTGTGAYILKAGSSNKVPLSVQGAVGQTANLLEAKTSIGTVVFSVSVAGNISFSGSGTISVNSTVTGNLTVAGNATLGDAASDTLTVAATSTFSAPVSVVSTSSFTGNVTMNNLTVNNGFTVNGALFSATRIVFSSGSAVIAAQYSVGRDADATNQLHFNVPSSATMEWSVNDAAFMTMGATGRVRMTAVSQTLTVSGGSQTRSAPGFQVDDGVRSGIFAWDTSEFYMGTYSSTKCYLITNNTVAVTIDTAQLVTLAAGVVLSAAQTTLSNYLESTFTPTVTLVGGAGNTVPVYSTNTGRYTRIGNRVFVDVYLTGDGGAEGAGTGTFNVALPIAANASHPTSFFPTGYAKNNATEYELFGQIQGSASTIELQYFNLISTSAAFSGADQNNSTRTVRLKFVYEV